jgi:glyoxylase-like metal-dependent hydrolase (beta-lactamase superfamily II)
MRRLMPDLWACGHPSALTDEAASYLLVRPDGNILIDVPDFHPGLVEELERLGDLRYIFLTHEDNVGEVDRFQAHFGAEVIMHAAEAHAVHLGVDRPFTESFRLFDDVTVLATPGHSPGSGCLLWHARGGCLFTGDHLLPVAGRLAPVRYDWTHDWATQLTEAERLLALPWNHAMPGRGAEDMPLGFVPQGRAKLAEALGAMAR